jgi:membrane fusion protein, multidrug efflux system
MKRFVSKSVIIAAGVALLATLWMLTGLGGSSGSSGGPPSKGPDVERGPVIRVSVRESRARPVTREITISGRTEPNRRVELRAETDGRVIALGADRGGAVSAGDTIVTLDLRDRNARLAEAEALVEQRELEHRAVQQLEGRQLASQAQIAEAYARLVGARAVLEQIGLDIERTSVAAPFDGVVQERYVELGDFVSIGDRIAALVDTNPLVVVGDVSEREVGELEAGSIGSARLLSGETVQGRVRYLASVAEQSTRTFRIELEIPNPERTLRAGMTTEMRLATGEVDGHFLSSALLTLDDHGTVGIKAVDRGGMVVFHPVNVIGSNSEGIWVSGLPERLRVISVGQGFVQPGQIVEAVDDPAAIASRLDDLAIAD